MATRRTAATAALAAMIVAVGLPLAHTPLLAATPPARVGHDPSKATSSRTARQSALRSIPVDRLSPEAQAKVDSVLSNVTFFRRLPIQVIQCDPCLYLFLVQHPDVVANIFEVMGATRMAVQQTGPATFRVIDAAGTQGSIEYLYTSHDTHVIYSEGSYDGPLCVRPVRGRSLIVLKTGYVRETDGRWYITCRLDSFTNVQNVGAELLTKTFQPLVGKAADINFARIAAFVAGLSRTAERNYPGVGRLAGQLSRVRPEVRREFALLAERIAQEAPLVQDHGDTGHPPMLAERSTQPDTSRQ